MNNYIYKGSGKIVKAFQPPFTIEIKDTLTGGYKVASPKDWIVRDAVGPYVVDTEHFEKYYQKVEINDL